MRLRHSISWWACCSLYLVGGTCYLPSRKKSFIWIQIWLFCLFYLYSSHTTLHNCKIGNENCCPYIKLLKESLRMWKKSCSVCMKDNCIFRSFVCSLLSAFMTNFLHSNSHFIMISLMNLAINYDRINLKKSKFTNI